ncbi:dihydrouridine synthase-domain-containing protein [Hygrophoropsis aurantiaca]|uniref:Dihydrouridine synthase-domain-containing protein n=1 Tax=Hygrophoropsis aurantiaca TaxID=72124 RepID=A0ACB7ZVZ1_9AGAM|nr:dihydrouridine synthase-domain-containing protein [Hygrophoropsis aurantiaca]
MAPHTTLQAPATRKLAGYEFYREVLGSPKYVVAPMVDQSELAWRILSRRLGAQLIYTPMINAKMFSSPSSTRYRLSAFNLPNTEEGHPSLDRPLIVQFAANDPAQLLASARLVEDRCDAVDINLGCPQDIAKRGRYGAFLQDDWELIYQMINTLHTNLKIPVTAKFRIFPSIEKTVQYAQMLERAGAQILTCHGRVREQRGQNTGLASYAHIAAVKRAVRVPVLANGNILFHADIERCLAETGADGVMCAEGQLYNAALFVGEGSSPLSTILSHSPSTPAPTPIPAMHALSTAAHPPHTTLAQTYLSIVLHPTLKTKPPLSAVKGHMFKLLRPALGRPGMEDLRERTGRVGVGGGGGRSRGEGGGDGMWWAREFLDIVWEVEKRMEADASAALPAGHTIQTLTATDPATGLDILPHWLAQPYFRVAKEKKEVVEVEAEVLVVGEKDKGVTRSPLVLDGIKRAMVAHEAREPESVLVA